MRTQEYDKAAVERFTKEMLFKLRENRDKDHWKDVGQHILFKRLLDEVTELYEALFIHQTPIDIKLECADVANFVMMIADNETFEICDLCGNTGTHMVDRGFGPQAEICPKCKGRSAQ